MGLIARLWAWAHVPEAPEADASLRERLGYADASDGEWAHLRGRMTGLPVPPSDHPTATGWQVIEVEEHLNPKDGLWISATTRWQQVTDSVSTDGRNDHRERRTWIEK